jgi:hypothetical protein
MRVAPPPVIQVLAVLTTIFLFASCAPGRSSVDVLKQKIAPEKLREDVVLLHKILEANHPGLYLYTPKDSIDASFQATIAGLTDSLTIAQFRNRLAHTISLIKCGHTAIRYPEDYARASVSQRNAPRFPLSIKTWDDSLVVIGNMNRKDSVFKRGTIITAINGRSQRQILDSMFRLIGTDGNANNFKSQLISFNFPAHYKNTFGTDSSYTIRYIDDEGKEQETVLPNFVPVRDTARRNNRPPVPLSPPLTRKEIRQAELANKRSMSIDTSLRTAYMRVSTFSGGQLRSFFRRAFRQLDKDSIQHLVIDLRENGGGSIGVSNRFTRYITDHPFKVADTVAAKSRRFRYGHYIHPTWIYWLTMQLTSHKKKDGLYHFGFYERHAFKPVHNHAFKGQVYILQGGFTFSAAAMFVSHVKGQKNVILAGEETGGGQYGNNSVHLPVIRLPHSNMQVVLPLYKVVLDNSALPTGRGIRPDLPIPPTSSAIRDGVDLKMETIKKQIIQAAHPAQSSPQHNPL